MKKYTGEDIFLAIGEIDESLLAVPSRSRLRGALIGKLTVAASIVLTVAVIFVFITSGGLGNISSNKDGLGGNSSAEPDSNGPSSSPDFDENDGYFDDTDNNAPGDSGENIPSAPGDGSQDDGGAAGGEGDSADDVQKNPDRIVIGSDGRLLNVQATATVAPTNGYLCIYLDTNADYTYTICHSQTGEELQYEPVSGGTYRLYTTEGDGKLVITSDGYDFYAIVLEYEYRDGVYYCTITYDYY